MGFWVFDFFGVLGFWGFGVFGFWGFWVFGFLGFWVFGFLGLGFRDTGILGYWGFAKLRGYLIGILFYKGDPTIWGSILGGPLRVFDGCRVYSVYMLSSFHDGSFLLPEVRGGRLEIVTPKSALGYRIPHRESLRISASLV